MKLHFLHPSLCFLQHIVYLYKSVTFSLQSLWYKQKILYKIQYILVHQAVYAEKSYQQKHVYHLFNSHATLQYQGNQGQEKAQCIKQKNVLIFKVFSFKCYTLQNAKSTHCKKSKIYFESLLHLISNLDLMLIFLLISFISLDYFLQDIKVEFINSEFLLIKARNVVINMVDTPS